MKCTDCGQVFEYLQEEIDAYSHFKIPLPENCSWCRQVRRLAFRNEKILYYNKSYLSGKQIIALYPKDSPFRVVDQDEWWNDRFDASIYSRDFDFNRPFFEQFAEFQKEVPRWSRIFLNCENADFTNNCDQVKNSYLAFSSTKSENIYYSVRCYNSNTCIDCMRVHYSEYCCGCLSCLKLYNVHFSQISENCHDSYFLYDCKNCSDCILCAGLSNKQYMVMNEQYSKEDYLIQKEKFLKQLNQDINKTWDLFEQTKRSVYHKYTNSTNYENCTGDYIGNSKSVKNGFNIMDCEDCTNIYSSYYMKDCHDQFSMDKSELCLECDTSYELYNSKFCTYTVGIKNCEYCDQCFYIQDSFACIGLKRGHHLIFNKQYSEEEYSEMINKIKEHMKRTGEYGKPFPMKLSSFSYNETVAQDEKPMTKEEALNNGLRWYESTEEAKHFGLEYSIKDNLEGIDKTICDKILICEVTGKNYKIIPQEFEFYKKFNLPFPRTCPDQRYRKILSLQNLQKLRDSNCDLCNKPTQTTFKENLGYKIICEECYLKQKY